MNHVLQPSQLHRSLASALRYSILLLLIFSAGRGWGQTSLPIFRTIWNGAEPAGWTTSGTGTRTTTFACTGSNARIFDDTGDRSTVHFSSDPEELNFQLKRASMSGGSKMVVEASVDGSSWSLLGEYGTAAGATPITDCANIAISLSAMVRYVRWTYTKATGNCDLDEVSISAASSACAAPTTQASNITFSTITGSNMTVNWTNGNGAGRVVKMNTSSTITAPSTGDNPTASTAYSGGQQVVFNGTGSGPITVTGLTSGLTYWYQVFEYCSPDRVYQSSTTTNNPNSQATSGVVTGTISGAPFCVGGGSGASVSVPYTITGSFTGGNVFTAQLSNTSGSFATPTEIGTLSSTAAGAISATIPAATPAGTGYRIRVISSTPAVIGTQTAAFTIRNLTAPSGVVASCASAEGSVSWSNPNCFDEVMVVVKDGTFSSTLPTGDGSAYTENLTFGSGTPFDGGFVVYKGALSTSGAVEGLTNGVEYSFKVFSRKDTLWLASSTDECTPENVCALEDFANLPTGSPGNYLSRSWTGTDGVTWTAEGARTDQSLTGKAICFGDNSHGNRWVTSPTYADGIGTLTFRYVRGFTGTGTRTLQVWVNGTQIGSNISVSTTSDVPVTYSEPINIAGDVVVQIRSTTAGQVIVDDISWTCNEAPPCTTPSNQPTALNLTTVSMTQIDGSFTAATSSPYGYLTVAYPTSGSASDAPVDEITYSLGDPLGTGIVVGVGTTTSFSASGLSSGIEYSFRVYSFNASVCTGGPLYQTTTPLTTNAFTLPQNVSGLTTSCADGTSMQISWTAPAGGSDGFVIAVRATSAVHVISGNNSLFTPNTTFGSGYEFGGTTPYSYVVYRGTGTSVTVTGLTPGTNYHIKASTFVSSNLWSTGTTTTQVAQVSDVTGALASPGNTEVTLTWTTPDVGCYDEVLVIARSTSAVTANPTGDGSDYSANATFGSGTEVMTGQYVVYKGAGTSELVTGLTNFTLYHFEVFVRKGMAWSPGIPLSATPNTATVLETGDLIIIAVNTQVLSSGSKDEVCFVAFKDITEYTSIDFTDNGFERLYAGEWGDTEGTIRFTRKAGSSTIPLGQVICFQGAGNSASNFDIQINGVNDNANWTILSLNSSLYDFDLNSNDQIWIMQNGGWINPSGSHNAIYTGNVLYGWTAIGWESAPGYASTAGSTIPEGLECFTTNVQGKTYPSKVKYTGPVSAATQRVWIGRVNDSDNWTDYANNADYNAESGRDYWGASLATITVLPGDFDEGVWEGTSNTNWFDCDNWQNLDVPDETVNVTVSTAASSNIVVNSSAEFAAQYGFIAKANNIDISRNQLILSGADTELEVYGDLTISGTGSLAFDATNATELTLYGDWNNLRSEAEVAEGLGLVRFAGGDAQTLSVQTGSAEVLHNIVLDKDAQTVLNLNDDLQTTATGSLSLVSGIIETGTNKVSVRNPASGAVSGFEGFSLALPGIYQNNGFIHGTIERQISGAGVYDFPVGDGVGGTESGYNRVVLDVASGNGLVEATYLPGSPGTIDVNTTTTCSSEEFDVFYSGMNEGYWRLVQNSGTTIAYDITAYPNTLAGISIPSNDDQYRLLKAPTSTSDWSSYALDGDPCEVSPSFYEVIGAGYSGFSDFGIGGGGTPLPVEIIAFGAQNAGDQVAISWATATELNSDFFTVERSADGLNFLKVLNVQAAGNSTSLIEYRVFDDQPLNGTSYYRLKQTDFDGSHSMTPVVSIQRGQHSGAPALWPNPTSGLLQWSGQVSREGYYSVSVLNLTGVEVMRQTLELQAGVQSFGLDISALPQGSYLLRVQGSDDVQISQVVKQ